MEFSLGRIEGFPSQYGEWFTPVIFDIVDIGILLFSLVLFICLFLISPISNNTYTYSYSIRTVISTFIGALILYNNYGQEWEVGSIHTNTTYKATSETANKIDANIGIKIGLRSINVTLKSKSLINENIDYNDRFEWTWDQGIIGFGLRSGHIQQEFRKAQYRGLPLPILSIVDNFIIDGENFRCGRFYRIAGWHIHALLHITFFLWIFAVFKFKAVVYYKSLTIILVGKTQLAANLIWHFVRNPVPLIIIFEDGQLITKYGLNFWANFVSGMICLILGIIMFIVSNMYPEVTAVFFGLDPTSADDIHKPAIENTQPPSNDIELKQLSITMESPDMLEEDIYA